MSETKEKKTKSKSVRPKSRKSVEGDAYICDLSDQELNLFLAISFGKFGRVLDCLEQIENIDMRNHDGQTLLIHAIHTTNGITCTHLVRKLIAKGSNINIQDVYGRTALMYACADIDHDDVVRNLIRQNSCDPNLVDYEGNSALMFAVAADSVPSVKILLTHRKIRNKVDVNLTNVIGLTAIDMAVALKSVECCKLLISNAGHKIGNIADPEGLDALIGVKMSSETSV